MELNLYGLEGTILLKMEAGEPITTTSKATREAKARLEAKGLIENDALTELGTSEAQSRKKFVGAVRDVYDLKPGGGYLRDIHLVYEPISPFSYAWNWCGLHGVSTVKTDPRKGNRFLRRRGNKLLVRGKLVKLRGNNLQHAHPGNHQGMGQRRPNIT